MNASLDDLHPSITYYDSDYPSKSGAVPENFDEVMELQGLAADVDRYITLADRYGSPVLELCCGTGRVGLELARAGLPVVGVDISQRMLDRFFARLEQEEKGTADRVHLVKQDVSALDLAMKDFPLAIIPFNSLLCITDSEAQLLALHAAARHLRAGGRLVVDAMNPLILPLAGDPLPKPFLNRTRVDTRVRYTRFAAMGPMDQDQRQDLYGWYDEIHDDGTIRRTPYRMQWRLIFRYELELMLRMAGFVIEDVHGGHRCEPWTPSSRKLFITARLAGATKERAGAAGGMDVI